jgi:TolB-like protein/DNA-binding winged helix-turn-helix (wHTH) protein/tetratricopeptide (TPR) repeat protein
MGTKKNGRANGQQPFMTKPLTSKPAAVCFDGWSLDQGTGELERDGKRQRLQDLPLQILNELVSRPGELVTRERLIAKLWPQGVVDFETGLNTAVSKLRFALGDSAETPRYIETVPRKGYRFIGSIAGDIAHRSPVLESAAPAAKPIRVLLWGGALLVLAITLALFNGYGTKQSSDIRLAVLPLENMSPDPANAFFADGIHEEIVNALTNRATQMDVISRTTMMTYRTRPKTVREIAEELGATHVLEGSVRREAQDVRLTLQLIDARNDQPIWSNSYDRQLTSAMKLQIEVAQEVATRLSVKLSPPSADLPGSANPEAYDLFLRAKLVVQPIDQRTPPSTILETERWLDRAIELDTAFAAAYVQRAQLRLIKYVWNFDSSESNMQGAKADIDAALRLAGDHPEVLQIESRHANLRGGSRRTAELVELPQMIASKNPTVMRWRAWVLFRQGRFEEGVELFTKLDELDPRNIGNIYSWSSELWSAKRGVEALRAIQNFNRRGAGTFDYGGLVFAFTGNLEQLRYDVERMSDSIDPDTRLAAAYDVLRYEGRFSELLPLLQRWPNEDHATIPTLRPRGFREPQTPGLGRKPLAELSGWAKLLTSDAPAAADDGRTLLRYAADDISSNQTGARYLRILKAEGELFSGNHAVAVSEARAALAMFPPRGTARRFAASQLAKVFAWAGAEDDAVTLLEEVSTQFPMLGPAEIARDPLYSIPLSNNARYRALESKLEAEIADNRALLVSGAVGQP